jgi:hypothetical protein
MPIPDDLAALYEVHEWRNGIALLEHAHPEEWRDIVEVLREFRLKRSYLAKSAAEDDVDDADDDSAGDTAAAAGGGNKSGIAKALDAAFTARGWVEALFDTQVNVTASRRLKGKRKKSDPPSEPFDAMTYAAPTHNVDCYKNHVALEVEWNNKNPFFDRDLNNFRLLFDLRSVEVGVIITRCDTLDEEIFEPLLGKKDSKSRYGKTTTHMGKLLPLLQGGGGGGCPVIVFGISPALYDPNS